MKTIKKKIWPEYFELIKSGKKRFEIRLADFDIKEGDKLLLQEWNPETREYTGKEIEVEAKYILKLDLNKFNQKEDIEKHGLYIIQF